MNDRHVQPIAEGSSGVQGGTLGQSLPGRVPGYELLRRLGAGAYGEVWVAMDKNTGRRVAIKFFTHRGRQDPSLLAREIEKLVALSADRTIVQLFEVGWSADPTYYVMEYLDSGSLEDRLRREGPLTIGLALEMFREIALGVSRAHGKGVLHCDLKPANILLDQDLRPRLADFGQARLTNEPRPALGTLFYMAPEQADLRAVPDTTWDIYALGAILYCMLTGVPPYRDETSISEIESTSNLEERLTRYRRHILESPTPSAHRRRPGVDRALADIIDRCLAAHPKSRYSHVVSVLQDLDTRERNRRRMPLMTLGLLGPLLILITLGFFARRAYIRTLNESRELVARAARESNRFAAEGEARNVASQLETRFRFIEQTAALKELHEIVRQLVNASEAKETLATLANLQSDPNEHALALSRFFQNPRRRSLDEFLNKYLNDPRAPRAASWWITDARGVQLAAAFDQAPPYSTIGRNFAYRTYFHGGDRDYTEDDCNHLPLKDTYLSRVFQSQATKTWKVAISTPIQDGDSVLGVIGLTVELGEFIRFPSSQDQCAILVDAREGDPAARGTVLQHPLYERFLRTPSGTIPDRFSSYRVDVQRLYQSTQHDFPDPLGADELGSEYRGAWITGFAEVGFERVNGDNQKEDYRTGLLVLVESRVTSSHRAVENLARWLFGQGVAALLGFVAVVLGTWLIVVQMSKTPSVNLQPSYDTHSSSPSSIHNRVTVDQEA